MKGINNILVATDLSNEADQALGHAIFLARLVKADVHLLHVMPGEDGQEVSPREVERVHERMEGAAARRLELTADRAQRRDVMLHTRVLQGMGVVPAVLAYAMRSRADLIVMGTRGRRAKDRPLWQSHAEEIARAASCPVLTVGRDAWSFPGMIRRVLVPLALTSEREPAVNVARTIAHHQNAEVDILHVVRPNIVMEGALGGGRLVRRNQEQRVFDELDAVYRGERGPDVRHRLHIRYGDPIAEVNNFARERRSNLIIVTSRGATGVQYALEGSVAAAIIGTAPCPVLTLKNHSAPATSAHAVTAAAGVQQ